MDRKTIRKDAKAKSRALMGTSRPSPVFVGCVVIIFGILVSMLTGEITGMDSYYERTMESLNRINSGEVVTQQQLEVMWVTANDSYDKLVREQSFVGNLIVIALRLMLVVVSLGFTIFCLNTVRRANPEFENLLDGFKFFIKFMLLRILMAILVFLWSLLFVVPGIVARYRYRMATYIMLDNPELGPLKCIKKSKEMMNGRKGEMFVLDLSFIGWKILELLPGVGYFSKVWSMPYIALTDVVYYERYRGENRSRSEDYNAL